MTERSANAPEPARWRTMLGDVVGFTAVIWSVPIAILLIGTPIVLVVAISRMAIRWIFG